MQDGVSFNARIVLLAGAFNVNTTFVVVQFSSLHRMSIVVTEVQAGRGARRDHVGECRSPIGWAGAELLNLGQFLYNYSTTGYQYEYHTPKLPTYKSQNIVHSIYSTVGHGMFF